MSKVALGLLYCTMVLLALGLVYCTMVLLALVQELLGYVSIEQDASSYSL